jgi:hypothetical protein
MRPPSPGKLISLRMSGIPVRLWWKIQETAHKQGVAPGYLVFKLLAEAMLYDQEGESYDLVLKEIKEHLGMDPA